MKNQIDTDSEYQIIASCRIVPEPGRSIVVEERILIAMSYIFESVSNNGTERTIAGALKEKFAVVIFNLLDRLIENL